VTPHFYTASDHSGWAGAPPEARANLTSLAQVLEVARARGGVPLRVTSGYRSRAYNAAVGGSSTSQHLTGSAADFVPVGVSLAEWANRVAPSLDPASFGQLILYPWTQGHAHLSLPNRASGRRGELLVEVGRNDYAAWTPGRPFPAWGSAGNIVQSEREGAAQVDLLLFMLIAAIVIAAI